MLIRKICVAFVLWFCTCCYCFAFGARPFFLEPEYLKNLPQSSIYVENMDVVFWNLDDDLVKKFAEYMPSMAPLVVKKYRGYHYDSDLASLLYQLEQSAKAGSMLGVFVPDDFSAKAAIAIAKKYNRPIIFVVKCPSDEVLNSYEWAYFAGYDLRDAGRKQGELFVAYARTHYIDFNRDGVISMIIIKGPADASATKEITAGFLEILARSDLPIRLLTSYTCNGKYNGGFSSLDFAATKFDIQNIEAIICNNDLMALGALYSIMRFCFNGYGSPWVIPIIGVGGSDLVFPKMKYGSILGTVKIETIKFAHMFTALAHELQEGNKPKYIRFARMDGKKAFIIFTRHASNTNHYLSYPEYAESWLIDGLRPKL